MNAPLRRVGVVVMILFGLLFVNLNWVQVYKAEEYRTDDEHNHIRVQTQEYERQRGTIVVDGTIPIATSKATEDTLKYQRVYASGPVYAHIIGYKPVNLASTNLERMENDFLAGTSNAFLDDRIVEMFTGDRSPGGNVLTTLNKKVQETAYRELTKNQIGADRGAVVALDPATGALLGLVSMPSFDPNKLTTHDGGAASDYYLKLEKDKNGPLRNRALAETFPPGSTFKVVVATAALQEGKQPSSVLVGGEDYQAPDTTQVIHNAPGVVCPNSITLKQALTVSCNTAFSRIGVEMGADKVKAAAEAYGFGTQATFQRDNDNKMNVAVSETGTMLNQDGQVDRPALAQSCIGQRDVRMTPLQGAMMAAAIANGGTQMRPYLVDTMQVGVRAIYQAQPQVLRQSTDSATAAKLREMMKSVVDNGTGQSAQIDGVEVGGKTGTAQNGDAPDHGWFVGYAMKDGKPVVAIAVLLQNAGESGSHEATRIAGKVMEAALAAKGLK